MRRILALLVVLFAVTVAQLSAQACPPPRPPPDPPPIEPGPRGRLTIHTSPTATVSMDGRALGPTPVLARYVDAGRHRLVLRASCGTIRRTVRVPPGQDVRLSLALCPSTRAPDPPTVRYRR